MKPRPAKRLRREDWLKHALETLHREGVAGLRVEPLARSLGVTTGSFYWHFKDRNELRTQVLEHWSHQMTNAVARRIGSDAEPGEQLRVLLREITLERRNRYETAMRNWARSDSMAAREVRKVDECRQAYLMGLFLQLGCSREQAELRSRLVACYQIGEEGLSINDSEEKRLRFAHLRYEMLIRDCE